MKATEKLLDHYNGDKKRAAKSLGVNPETLRLWLRDGIPLERALFIEEKTDRAVTAEEVLREARQAA
jgi:DNA-binding transcriptional regulator YdaS (Cro superfamily)